MVMRLFTLIAIAVLVAGCGSHVEESPRGSSSDWDKGWRDAEERLVREHVVGTASIDCVDDAVFLYLGWPLGTPFDKVYAAHVYERDPHGTLKTIGSLDTEVTLPDSARNTGYHLGTVQLWLGKDARKAAYLVEGSKVERWPRLIELVGCV
jgi:hypothetical protein